MNKSERIRLGTICIFTAFVLGLVSLKVYPLPAWFLNLGIVGSIPFLLLNGFHGDFEGAPAFFGSVLYVLVNGGIYYGVTVFILKRIRRRRNSRAQAAGKSNK
jgi:hypothetical protein